jgi:peptide deformylase
MAVRKIVTLPEPILRKKARKVSDFGASLQNLIDDMVETMRQAPGVGLAAPQVDVPMRVIVAEFGDEENEEVPAKLYSLVNPEIMRFSKEMTVGTEGCLSIPSYLGDVERPERITLKGFNRYGKPIRLKAKGWLARIIQHEIDHLNGILFIDLAERVWRMEEETAQVIPKT